MVLENLKLLETKFASFLARHQRVVSENQSLVMRLSEQDRAYDVLLGRLRRYEVERSEVRRRVSKILRQFEELGEQKQDKG